MKKGISITNKEAQELKEIVSRFDSANIMVIGDLILDEFIWGDVSRISPEAPVPVVLTQQETFKLGGACNVACNVSALGGNSYIVGITGKDDLAEKLGQFLKEKNINTDGVIVDANRRTTLKTRVVARQRNQQVVRIDKEITSDIDSYTLDKLISKIQKMVEKVDAIILEDYGKGVIIPALLKKVLEIAQINGKKVIVDPKKHHFDYYKGVTLITPNKSELEGATGIRIQSRESLEEAGKKLLSDLNCQALLVTLGEAGMYLFENGGSVVEIESVAQEVFDVSGAGDTVVSSFTQSLISGASLTQAALISNFAAGFVVAKFGTEVVTKEELITQISNHI